MTPTPREIARRLARLERACPDPRSGPWPDLLAVRIWLAPYDKHPNPDRPRNPDGSPMTLSDLVAALGGPEAVEPDSILARLAGLEPR
jgi:hypothetical protein